jgi:hypothetical protein
MKFSLKSIRFVIEALEQYRQHHDELIEQGGLSEDEIADLVNDRQYLEAIKQDCQEYRDRLIQQAANPIGDAMVDGSRR